MTNSKQVLIVLCIILITGILGGVGNFLFIVEDITTQNMIVNYSGFSFQRSLFLGVIAACIIPLFLNIISSNLLEIDVKAPNYKNYLIFGGLCLVASLFSNKFLSNAYENVFNQFDNKIESVKKIAVAAKTNSDAALDTEIRQNQHKEISTNFDSTNTTLTQIINSNNLNKLESEVFRKIMENQVIYKKDINETNDSTSLNNALKVLYQKNLIQPLSVEKELVFKAREFEK